MTVDRVSGKAWALHDAGDGDREVGPIVASLRRPEWPAPAQVEGNLVAVPVERRHRLPPFPPSPWKAENGMMRGLQDPNRV